MGFWPSLRAMVIWFTAAESSVSERTWKVVCAKEDLRRAIGERCAAEPAGARRDTRPLADTAACRDGHLALVKQTEHVARSRLKRNEYGSPAYMILGQEIAKKPQGLAPRGGSFGQGQQRGISGTHDQWLTLQSRWALSPHGNAASHRIGESMHT